MLGHGLEPRLGRQKKAIRHATKRGSDQPLSARTTRLGSLSHFVYDAGSGAMFAMHLEGLCLSDVENHAAQGQARGTGIPVVSCCAQPGDHHFLASISLICRTYCLLHCGRCLTRDGFVLSSRSVPLLDESIIYQGAGLIDGSLASETYPGALQRVSRCCGR